MMQLSFPVMRNITTSYYKPIAFFIINYRGAQSNFEDP